MVRCVTLTLIFAVSVVVHGDDIVKAPEETGEFVSIFNGIDLIGWDGDPQLWSVKDGVIHGETTEEHAAQGNTFIIWKDGTTKTLNCDSRSVAMRPTIQAFNTVQNILLPTMCATSGLSEDISMNCGTKRRYQTCLALFMTKGANAAGSALSEKRPHGKRTARKSRKP